MIWKGGRPAGNEQESKLNASVGLHTCQVQVDMVVVALTNRRKYMRTIVRFKHRQRLWVQSSRWSGNPIHIVSIFFGDDETWTLRIRYLIGRVKTRVSNRGMHLPREARRSPCF